MKTNYLLRLACIYLGLISLLTATANAALFSYDFTAAGYGSSDWTPNGSGGWATDGALSPTQRLRMTSNGTGQAGTVWMNTTAIRPTEDWSISMTGQFSFPTGTGADGLTLILQNYGLSALPSGADFSATSGTGLGTEYLCFELDSYQNVGEQPNGMQFYSKLGSQYTELTGSRLEGNNFTFTLNVNYSKSLQTLEYTFQRSGFADVTVTRTVFDMATRFEGDLAYVGFWGGSGAEGENHDVLSMTMNATAVPEPSSYAMIGGLLCLGTAIVRRIRAKA